MFGKAKKLELGKPRDAAESIKVKSELKKKYPQMFSGPAKARPKSAVAKIKQHQADSRNSLEEALSGDEIARLTGKKKSK